MDPKDFVPISEFKSLYGINGKALKKVYLYNESANGADDVEELEDSAKQALEEAIRGKTNNFAVAFKADAAYLKETA